MEEHKRPPSRAGHLRDIKQDARVYVTSARNASRDIPGSYSTGVGSQFAGTREVYTAAGYKEVVTYADVLQAWEREHIAKRVVNIFPDYTWRNSPIIVDGSDDDGERDTEFCNAFNALWTSGQTLDDGDTRTGLDYWVPALDRVSLMGKWGVLFLGLVGNESMDQPLTKGQFDGIGPRALAYASVYGESSAVVSKWDNDIHSPRYGKPMLYNLTSYRDGVSMSVNSVHWTRVIHVAQGGLASLVEGISALTHVYNLLQDLLKIMAGTGESGYRNADPGMVVTTQPAFEAPQGDEVSELLNIANDEQGEAYLDQIRDGLEAYFHGLQRYMVLEGFDVKMLTGDVSDPRGPVSTIIDLIAGATGIPQRLLLGNEAGQLASSQDQANWASVIEGRREQIAEPTILRPLINRLIWAGILPEPSGGIDSNVPYSFVWPSLYSINPQEQATIAGVIADVLNKLGIVVEAETFLATFVPELDPATVLPAGVSPPPVEPDTTLENGNGGINAYYP